MDKVRKIILSSFFMDIFVLILILSVCTFFFGNHIGTVFSDRGREFLIPQMILEGLKPYQEITLIYFPLSYYINAFVYKIFGVSVNSLLISQTVVCSLFVGTFYMLSREFFSRFTALSFNIFIISCCIFSCDDLFSYIMPYSYSKVYGILGAILFLFFFVKLFKTDKISYLYFSSLFAGFSFAFKLEFYVVPLMLVFGLLLYKRLSLKEYFKAFFCVLIFPVLSFCLLLSQGVPISSLRESMEFAFTFAKTPVMTQFLSLAGLYPFELRENFKQFFSDLPIFLCSILIISGAFLFTKKFSKLIFVPFIFLAMGGLYCLSKGSNEFWVWVPFAFLLLFLAFFRKLRTDKLVLFLAVSCLFFGQRELFKLSIMDYGIYSLPVIIFGFLVVLNKIFEEKYPAKYLSFILAGFSFMYFCSLAQSRALTNYRLETPKGTIYTTENNKKLLSETVDYILNNTSKNDKILVLPEGNILNFVTDRQVSSKCFMMDRLYHDAYGEIRSKEMVENSDSDYIFIIKNEDIYNFERPELYDEDSQNETAKYIFNNYKKQITIYGKDSENHINIYKRSEER